MRSNLPTRHALAIAAVLVAGFAVPSLATADTATVKDWVVETEGDGTAGAHTSNDSGSTFGVFCSDKDSCIAYLDSSTGCEDKSKSPVLVNSDSGAQSFDATCAALGTSEGARHFAIVFDDFGTLMKLVLKDHTIGFSIPLQSGRFKVTRFSLEGSSETIAAANKLLNTAARAPNVKATIL